MYFNGNRKQRARSGTAFLFADDRGRPEREPALQPLEFDYSAFCISTYFSGSMIGSDDL